MEYVKEDKNLSASETVIMRAIWAAGEDIAVTDLIEVLRVRYGKDYARTTIATFLLRLSEKGYIGIYRKGKPSYIHALKSEEEYKKKLLQEETEFWYGGSVANLISTLCRAKKPSREEVSHIRRMLDELDD